MKQVLALKQKRSNTKKYILVQVAIVVPPVFKIA
jgi:hypothetical protein